MSRGAVNHPAVSILGLGEAGSRLAADLVALDVLVQAWDPEPKGEVAGVRFADGPTTAVTGTDCVLSTNAAAVALDVARSVEPALAPGQLYADLNTASPAVKVELARLVAEHGALFTDVALLGPVPNHGLHTRSIASGPGAEEFARVFGPLGMPVEVIGAEPGDAATLKLVRSIFMKGMAAAALESMQAAAKVGRRQWLHDEIAAALDGAGGPLLDRLLVGSERHAVRRIDEMDAASELLRELGVEPRIAASSLSVLLDLAQETVSAE